MINQSWAVYNLLNRFRSLLGSGGELSLHTVNSAANLRLKGIWSISLEGSVGGAWGQYLP
jgi:hypothetical protein